MSFSTHLAIKLDVHAYTELPDYAPSAPGLPFIVAQDLCPITG